MKEKIFSGKERKDEKMAIHVLDEAKTMFELQGSPVSERVSHQYAIPQVIQLLLNGQLDKAGRMLLRIIP